MGVPATVTRTSHALSIRAGFRQIGAIHGWSPTQRRTIDTEFEVNALGHGLPVDVIGQNLEGREIRVTRYDTYASVMEGLFGTRELTVLTDQSRPFSVREHWVGPPQLGVGPSSILHELSGLAFGVGLGEAQQSLLRSAASVDGAVQAKLTTTGGRVAGALVNVLAADIRVYEYTCWFSDLGRQLSAEGDRRVNVDATLIWLTKERVL